MFRNEGSWVCVIFGFETGRGDELLLFLAIRRSQPYKVTDGQRGVVDDVSWQKITARSVYNINVYQGQFTWSSSSTYQIQQLKVLPYARRLSKPSRQIGMLLSLRNTQAIMYTCAEANKFLRGGSFCFVRRYSARFFEDISDSRPQSLGKSPQYLTQGRNLLSNLSPHRSSAKLKN